jgi:regulatory protein
MGPQEVEGYREAVAAAVRILSRREHSAFELRRKLARKGLPQDAIERAAAECLRLGYLNDERTTRMLIDRLKRKGCGLRRLRFELTQRGLSGDGISAVLEAVFSPEVEGNVAWRALERKWKTYPAGDDFDAKRERGRRFLAGRGFSEAGIHAALDRLARNRPTEEDAARG